MVAVALRTLEKGSSAIVDGGTVRIRETIPQGHKFALVPIKKGQRQMRISVPAPGFFSIQGNLLSLIERFHRLPDEFRCALPVDTILGSLNFRVRPVSAGYFKHHRRGIRQ